MDGYIDRQVLQNIANAIREKNGSSDTYKPNEMADAILNISDTPNLQNKQVTITENGITRIVPDEEYKGMNEVNINVEVYDNFAISYQEDTQTIVITSPQYVETADNRRF